MPVQDPFQKVYDTTGHQGWAYPDEHERATAVRPKPSDKVRGAIGDTAFEVLTDLAGAGVPARSAAPSTCRFALRESSFKLSLCPTWFTMAVEMLLRARAGGEVAALPLSFVRRCTANFCDETRLLGAGGSAKVYRAEAAAEDDEEAAALPAFAVKRLNGTAAFRNGTVDGAPSADDGSRARAAAAAGLEHEIEVLCRYRHPHIAALLGVARGPDGDGHEHELCLAYDLGEDGSVAACLADDGRAEQLGWKARVRVAAAVGRALSYLHHHGAAPVFHRDVKSANVVLCAAMSSAKLVDFDRCGTAADHAAAASAAVGTAAAAAAAAGGTREYMCPSYLRTGAYDARSEIFSFGMLLLELLTGRLQCTPGGPGAGGGGREDDLFGRFVEEAEEPLLGALDERAGAWPAPVAGELIALALTCAGPRKERPASIRVAVRRLGALEHGAAAPMPGELRQLAAHLATLSTLETAPGCKRPLRQLDG